MRSRSARALAACLFAATAPAMAEPTVLAVGSLADPLAISPAFIGYNNQTGSAPHPWSNPERVRALIRAAPAHLRYPGGTISSYWDMRADRVFLAGRKIDLQSGVVLNEGYIIGWMRRLAAAPQPNPIADLGSIGHAFPASARPPEILFVMNLCTPGHDFYQRLWERPVDPTPLSADWWAMLEDRLERNLHAYERLRATGLQAARVELGNEYFFGISAEPYVSGGQLFEQQGKQRRFHGKFITGAFPGLGEAYASAVNDWAAKLKLRYPDIEICAVASDVSNPRQSDRRREWNRRVVGQFDRKAVDAISLHVYDQPPSGLDLSQGSFALGRWAGSWKRHWEETLALSALPRDYGIWITEWDNGFGSAPKNWAHALIGCFTLSQWLETGQVRLASYHQFDSSHRGDRIAPIAQALRLWSLASRGRHQARRIELVYTPMLPGTYDDESETALPAVFAWAFEGSADAPPACFLANLGDSAYRFDTRTLPFPVSQATQSSHADLENEGEIGETELPATSATPLPPYSLTVLR